MNHQRTAKTNSGTRMPCQSRKSYSVCISGWYGSGNIGDEAILTQFIREINPSPDISLSILAYDVRRAYALYARSHIEVLDHPLILDKWAPLNLLRRRVRTLIRAIKSADLFVLGGGSLLADRSRLRTLIHLLDEVWLAKLFGRKVALYAIGVGPLRRKFARWLVAATVCKCDLIAVRDVGSKELLASIGVPGSRIEVVADPALLLSAQPVLLDRLKFSAKKSEELKRNTLGVFLIDDLGIDPVRKDAVVSSLVTAFDILHEKRGTKFVFVPMMSELNDDDRLIAREVARRMSSNGCAYVIEETLSPAETMWLAGQFRANIAMRLHSFLFSLAMRTPAVAISCDPKMTNAARDFGLEEYVIPFERLCGSVIEQAIIHLEGTSSSYINKLNAVLPKQQQSAIRMFTLIRELIVASGRR